ncbi:MAG: PadR family transcriptional regulator [Anaerolineae bacterium]|nr:PadR family transcriptional regulator [Anaerolineae bacterium]
MPETSGMLSDLELVILTYLGESSTTLIELDRELAVRGVGDWLVYSRSAIVDVLKRLAAQGLVEHSPVDGQTVYTISEAGSGTLQTALGELLRYPMSMNGFALALSSLRALRPAMVYQALKARRAALNQQTDALLRGITDRSKAQEEIEMFSYLMELTRIETEWLDEFMQRWAKRFPAVTASIGDQDYGDGVDHKAPTAVQRRTKPIRNTKTLQRIKRPKI